MNKKRVRAGLLAVAVAYLIMALVQLYSAYPSIGRIVFTVVIVIILTIGIFFMGYVSPLGEDKIKND